MKRTARSNSTVELYTCKATSVSYQRGSRKRLMSGVQRAPPAGCRARLSVAIVAPTRFQSESFSEAPIPSADGKEVGQYLRQVTSTQHMDTRRGAMHIDWGRDFRPAESTPQPALTPCSASPTGTAGTPSRGMPP